MKKLPTLALALVALDAFAVLIVAQPVVAGTSVSATSLSSSSVRVDFTADDRAHQWEVCWKRGRYNPVPTCSGFASSSAFAGNGLNSGSYTVTGLKSNSWHTFKVRGLFIKPNGSVQTVWHFVGKTEVKTPK